MVDIAIEASHGETNYINYQLQRLLSKQCSIFWVSAARRRLVTGIGFAGILMAMQWREYAHDHVGDSRKHPLVSGQVIKARGERKG